MKTKQNFVPRSTMLSAIRDFSVVILNEGKDLKNQILLLFGPQHDKLKYCSDLTSSIRSCIFILMMFGFTLTASAAVSGGLDECPVMPGEKAKSKFFVDYQGKRHFLCCRGCVRKFKKNPEKYLGKK